MLEALSREFKEGLPMELLYTDDLILMAETEELLLGKLRKWMKGMEAKRFIVNFGRQRLTGCLVDKGHVVSGEEGLE